jgi:Leucine-rich repeat (LRR) protein
MLDAELYTLIVQAKEEQWEEIDLSGQSLTELPPQIGELTHLRRLILGKWNEEEYEWVGNRLKTLPEAIAQLTQLETLSVANNQLTEIPTWVAQLPNLTELSISSNPVNSVPEWMRKLKKLTALDLAECQLTKVPEWITELSNLKELYLWSNQITEIPEEISQLQNLTKISFSFNQITEIPETIAQLQNLTYLGIGSNHLNSVPEWIRKLTKLTVLSIAKCQLAKVPDWIIELSNLQELYLWSNQITEIPETIAQLQDLSSLYLRSNQITEIPETITQLQNLKELDLGSNQITEIPEAIAQLQNLTNLHLSSNRITEIPEEISQLQNLTKISFSFNQITEIPEEISQLQNLTYLGIGSNHLNSVPEWIRKLTKLTVLNIAKCQLAKVPDWIIELSNLKELYLRSNQITEIPEAIGQLQNLSSLDLGSNQITEIPEAIGQLQNLSSLDLSSNQITEIPETIGQLQNLSSLDLSSNQITEIPEAIGQLQNLSSLDLSSNQITEIPEAIAQLQNLSSLYLSSNQITEIPEAIGQLQNLSSLNLRSNQITEIPETIAQLQDLSSLDLSSNQITEIPETITQLQNLKELDLGSNQITEIPETITQLQNLSSLYLRSNQITEIPEAIAQLQNLSSLDLSSNQITEIPETITQLQNLTNLHLSSNQITEIPETIGQLQNLSSLDLRSNQITEIPETSKALSKLKFLDLRGNPFSIPPEILSPKKGEFRPEARPILDYYFAVQDPEETVYLYEAKVLIVGDPEVGKTTLARKLDDPDYELPDPKDSVATHGIEIQPWEFSRSDDTLFRIHLWDFGGQDIYYETHQFFLTERSLYLLVADTRKDLPNFNYWFQIINLRSPTSPILIVENQRGDCPYNLNTKQIRATFNTAGEDFQTNLKTNTGLDQIKQGIAYYAQKLEHVGTPLPKRWYNIRYILQNNSRNYITLEQYQDICRRNGVTNPDEMLQISRFFHDIGTCLHFQENEILERILILKPNWGTRAIYKILKADTDAEPNPVRQNQGRFTKADLKILWHESTYASMRLELLELMRAFKLCYAIPALPDTYIAPRLLSPNPPTYDWDDSHNLILRYEYDFMPHGIISRFIVEMHNLIENGSGVNALVWQTGVVLRDTFSNTRARVQESFSRNEIVVHVAGNRKRDLMVKITHEFDKIHYGSNYKGLRFKTLVPCNCSECKDKTIPDSYDLVMLQNRVSKRKFIFPCNTSFEDIDARRLIDDVIDERRFSTEDHSSDVLDMNRRDQPSSKSQQPIIIENHIHNSQAQEQKMTNEKQQNLHGDYVRGDKVMGDKDTIGGNKMKTGEVAGDAIAGNKIVHSQNLAQAAQDIKALIAQLSHNYDTSTPPGRMRLSSDVLETVEKDSTLKSRVINALKEAGTTAVEEAIDHPIAKVLVAGFNGYME